MIQAGTRVLGMICLLLLVACLGAPALAQEPVRLRVGLRGDPQVWHDLIPQFHQAHPGIVVEHIEQVDWNMDKVILAELSGQPYDVVYTVIEQAWALAEAGIVMPLDRIMATDPEWVNEYVADVHPNLMRMWQQNGVQYYLPYEWNNMVMYYNPRLFDEAGLMYPGANWTWDEFLANAKQLTRRGPDGERLIDGYSCTWYNPFGFGPWIYSAGGQILNDSWTGSALNDPRVVEAVEFTRDLIHTEGVLNLGCDSIPETGRVGMWPAGRWVLYWYEEVNNFHDYDIQTWPVKERHATTLGGGGHAISVNSRNQEAAWTFMKWLNSPEIITYWTRIGDSSPSRASVATSDEILALPPANGMLYYEALDYATPVPAPPSYPEIEQVFHETLHRVWFGEISSREAVDEMHRLINVHLEAAN